MTKAQFVPLADAADRIREVPWLALTSSYLRGDLEAGSVLCQRWHEDGRVEAVG